MRNNLFLKIFFGFWLITISILASWLIATHYLESRPSGLDSLPGDISSHSNRNSARHRQREGPPRRFMLQLNYRLSNVPSEELKSTIERAKTLHDLDIYLLDESGGDIFQRDISPEMLRLAQTITGRRSRNFGRIDGQPSSVQQLYRHDQGVLRQLTVFPKPRHTMLRILSENIWMRLGLAVLISGLACFGLSKLLTRRLAQLRNATRRLAAGNLDTRLTVPPTGGDETHELARDFNAMAEQLQQRIKSQGRLLTDVSHELRSPIARLRVALALAQEASDKRPDHLQRIARETASLETLISQLLSTQTAKVELDAHIDLRILLEELCTDASFEGERDGKKYHFECDLTQAVLASSGDLLHRSFENIIRNALHHTAPNTIVKVALAKDDGAYVITVEDRGPGVAEAELSKIFDEFYRVDPARTRNSGGYGLGLAIARRALESHGGEVRANNTATGLCVSVTLPIDR